MPENIKQLVLGNPVHILSFGFGAGLSPIAPGTAGTLFAIPVYLVLASFSTAAYILFVTIAFAAGCWCSQQTANALGVHDHPGIVIDEIVGYLVTMFLVPTTWYWVLSGFILFRIFDIWKPWPISMAERRFKNGLGIMLDDLLAALYSLLFLHIIIWSLQ